MGKEGELEFNVGGKRAALHVRNSAAEFVSNPDYRYRKVDAVVKTSPESFARYFRGELTATDFIKESGADAQAASLLAMFDEYRQKPMYP